MKNTKLLDKKLLKKKYLKKSLVAIALAATSISAFADNQTQQLEQRVDYLEQLVKDQNSVLAKKNDKQGAESGFGIEFGATVEVEASYVSPENGESESDIVAATVELGAALNFTEQLSGEIIFLYEEDDTDLEVDVAQITYDFANSPLSATLGQLYVPFGVYETGLISDPLTLEIGEARETVLSLGLETGGFNSSFYIFNGDVDDGDNNIDNFGFNVGYGNDVFSLGFGYINSLGDSDAIQEALSEEGVAEYTDGVTLNGALNLGPITLIAEYTAALDGFDELDGAEPSATNLEIDFNTSLFGKSSTLGLAYQTTDEALFLELPETRILLGLGIEINDHLSVGIEYSRDSDYEQNDGGTGEDTDALVLQFAASL